MPSTSAKQHRFMEAVAHNSAFAKKAGVPQSVGKDFSAADKGRKFQKGGATMMGKKVPNAMADMMARRRMGSGMAPPAPPVMPPQPSAPMGMKKGGMAGYSKGGNMNAKGSMSGSSRAGENTKIQKKGLTEGRVIKMASGGSVSSRADGVAVKGKTVGKLLAKGGKSC